MTSKPNDLIKDPLFQLNTLLWLAQPLPSGSEVTPLFYMNEFTVYAIAPLLGLPPDLRLMALEAQIIIQDRIRPDVVLGQERGQKFVFTECKSSSFGPNSSTAEQARSLLIVAGSRAAEVLGLDSSQVSDSLLAFLTPDCDQEPLTRTLTNLREEMRENRLPVGQFSVIGLLMTNSNISIVINKMGSEFLELPLGITPFMKRELGTDPRLLYFIPYDPDIMQSEQEKVFCKRVLFERMQSTVVAAVGRANPPAELSLESEKILNDALFGMYEHWENPDSAKHMRRLFRQFMDPLTKAVNSVNPETMFFQPGEGWKIKLQDQEQHEKIIETLTRFYCDTLDLRKEPEPTLFDEMENSGITR